MGAVALMRVLAIVERQVFIKATLQLFQKVRVGSKVRRVYDGPRKTNENEGNPEESTTRYLAVGKGI